MRQPPLARDKTRETGMAADGSGGGRRIQRRPNLRFT
ncbi:hypothetical protein CITRIK5_30125 [Citricoccus sp. K5]|nr:hypothetical protein CITRIK5_30125 [Citricoccus sp. K5]